MSSILTGEEVISAIAIKLRAGFSSTEIQAIYKDTPTQDILKPNIFLNLISVTQTPLMNNKSNRLYLIDIIVSGSDSNNELYTWYNKVAEKIFGLVDNITISNMTVKMIRGEASIENEELHLIVSYNVNVIKQNDDENIKMQTRKFEGRVI